MSISVVRLGSPRGRNEGLRVGTVRRPPRGVKKADIAKRDFYDVWLPIVSPSPALIAQLKNRRMTRRGSGSSAAIAPK